MTDNDRSVAELIPNSSREDNIVVEGGERNKFADF